jgi:hypothetical protein
VLFNHINNLSSSKHFLHVLVLKGTLHAKHYFTRHKFAQKETIYGIDILISITPTCHLSVVNVNLLVGSTRVCGPTIGDSSSLLACCTFIVLLIDAMHYIFVRNDVLGSYITLVPLSKIIMSCRAL